MSPILHFPIVIASLFALLKHLAAKGCELMKVVLQ